MSEPSFVEIPASLPARVQSLSASRVPKVIVQTFRSRRVPPSMAAAISTWITLNPEYAYRCFDDSDLLEVVENADCSALACSRSDLLRAIRRLKPGAGKADLFRYLLIYQQGGVYMDIDTQCLAPLHTYVHPEDDVVSGVGLRGDFHQWGLIYSPRHPFMRVALETAVSNVLRGSFVRGYENTLEGLAGPPCLDVAIKTVLGIPREARFRPGLYELPIEGRVSRIRLLGDDLFGGHVGFRYEGYVQDLSRLGLKHWQDETLFEASDGD